MEKRKYFLDTYALIEILKGNDNYKFVLDEEFYTFIINLHELFYIIKRDYDDHTAKKAFLRFRNFIIEIKDEHIFLATEIRLKNKDKKFSYIDTLGYSTTKINNLIFLTGDEAFRGMEKVKIIKKLS